MCGFGCWEKIVMSSAWESMCTSGCVGSGMSCMRRMKRVGEITDPWGTPLGKRLLLDGVPLWTV